MHWQNTTKIKWRHNIELALISNGSQDIMAKWREQNGSENVAYYIYTWLIIRYRYKRINVELYIRVLLRKNTNTIESSSMYTFNHLEIYNYRCSAKLQFRLQKFRAYFVLYRYPCQLLSEVPMQKLLISNSNSVYCSTQKYVIAINLKTSFCLIPMTEMPIEHICIQFREEKCKFQNISPKAGKPRWPVCF